MELTLFYCLSQAMVVLKATFTIIGGRSKTQKQFMFWQVLFSIANSLKYLFLGAYTGLVSSSSTLCANIIFYKYKQKNKNIPWQILITLYILTIGIASFTWVGYISIFPMITSLIGLFGKWQKKLFTTKLLRILVCCLWTVYAVYYHSWFDCVANAFEIIALFSRLRKNEEIKEKQINMKREEAYKILEKNITKPNLIKHCLAVESVMRHFAKLNNEDIEYWGNVGLLHDIDYELYPEEHCKKYREVLQDNFDDDFIKTLESHGYGLCTDVLPEKFMEKILITIDQLTGFITACALILPSKKLADVEMKSMLKKWKNKGFAGGTQRERIEHWTNQLGYTLEYMLEQTLIGMKNISNELEL